MTPDATPDRFQDLAALFSDMDRTWDRVASEYGFQCRGCEDNCCFSLFFHHTHVERAYLISGFSELPRADRAEILAKAEDYCTRTFGPEDTAGAALEPASRKRPCPLLLDGRCRLYVYRPMICRMHGLPHELHKPGMPVIKGPGCDAGRFGEHAYVPFDRTPFYRRMAGIEMAYRDAAGVSGKVKETIAQILLSTGR